MRSPTLRILSAVLPLALYFADGESRARELNVDPAAPQADLQIMTFRGEIRGGIPTCTCCGAFPPYDGPLITRTLDAQFNPGSTSVAEISVRWAGGGQLSPMPEIQYRNL
jgi:hypothetical protein